MSRIDRAAALVTEHAWLVVAVMVLATAALGAGAANVDQRASISGLSSDSDVAAAQDAARENFTARDGNTTTAVIAVRNEGGNVLSRDSLLRSLRYQRALRANDTLNATLVAEQPTTGVANVVGAAAVAERRDGGDGRPQQDGGPPPLDAQIAALEALDDEETAALVRRTLDPDRSPATADAALRHLPQSYEPGTASAEARLLVVTQETDGTVLASAALSEEVARGQLAAREIAREADGPESHSVVGRGLVGYQQDAAIGDSLAILGPLALAFVCLALSLAYRSAVDVAIGLVGVTVVLIWTIGAMGWLGIPFGQSMIAAPILLIGLSVDYGFHLIMRYREERAGSGDDVPESMARSLGAVAPALGLVTATTAIGFLANLTSPLGGVRDFGVVTAIGIGATLLVFCLLMPALKTIVASFRERRAWDCTPAPPGSSGAAGRLLRGGATAARRAPFVVLALALLVGAAGAYGAADVETSASQELFMADDPPAWTEDLPDAVAPGEYFLKENRRAVFETFQAPARQGYVVVDGNVTAPGTLDRVAAAQERQVESDVAFVDPRGEPAVETPLSAMRAAAATNETFNATFAAADSDGDGVPDRNLAAVYDAFYAAAPDRAARTVHRTDDGEYASLRLRMGLDGDADQDAVVTVLRESAAEFDGSDAVRATATGTPLIDAETTDRVTETMIGGLAVTLAVVLALLAVVFRLREGSATLGAVTLVPVALSVTWLLGTMAVLDIPISPITSVVGGIAVGLGVDYAIHVSERFAQERGDGADAETALLRTVTGTGGAMLSSAATTAAGFGVLSFALLPALRQFGLVLAVGIVYAFLASVYVQPSMLALWDRYGSPRRDSAGAAAVTSDD